MEIIILIVAVGIMFIFNVLAVALMQHTVELSFKGVLSVFRQAITDIEDMVLDQEKKEREEHLKTRKDIQEVKTAQRQIRKDLNEIQKVTRALSKSILGKLTKPTKK